MSRQTKVRLLKDALSGQVSLFDLQPIVFTRLTNSELKLLLWLGEEVERQGRPYSRQETECWEYYRKLSNQRPASAGDAMPDLDGADAIVREWYDRLNQNAQQA